jgi:hypothetical protein
VRIIFDVDVPSLSQFHCKAARNLQLNFHHGSDLRNFLWGLLGDDFFEAQSGKVVELQTLIGRKCKVVLTHFQGAGFQKPMVIVDRLLPADDETHPVQEGDGKGAKN